MLLAFIFCSTPSRSFLSLSNILLCQEIQSQTIWINDQLVLEHRASLARNGFKQQFGGSLYPSAKLEREDRPDMLLGPGIRFCSINWSIPAAAR